MRVHTKARACNISETRVSFTRGYQVSVELYRKMPYHKNFKARIPGQAVNAIYAINSGLPSIHQRFWNEQSVKKADGYKIHFKA